MTCEFFLVEDTASGVALKTNEIALLLVNGQSILSHETYLQNIRCSTG